VVRNQTAPKKRSLLGDNENKKKKKNVVQEPFQRRTTAEQPKPQRKKGRNSPGNTRGAQEKPRFGRSSRGGGGKELKSGAREGCQSTMKKKIAPKIKGRDEVKKRKALGVRKTEKAG